jgi:hypothetical protein
MSGIARRVTRILVLASVAAAVTASSGAAASPARTPILGIVPHSPHLAVAPHMLSKAIRAAGPATLTFSANYQTVINRYFTDIAHDSGGVANVYSVATQYTDNSGAVQYRSPFGGSYISHDPLPASVCDDGLDAYCLTDQQLQAEIQSALTAKGWRGGLDHVFFLLTPNGVGSCFTQFGQCSTDTFCAYHSDFTDSNNEQVIYANEPYEGPVPGCTDPTQGFPNDLDADTTVNTISHEHNEAVTDPLGNGWLASDGNENGDLCAYGFGTQTNPGPTAYNQVINGHHYDLQQEYSNADAGCIQHTGDPNVTQPPCAPPPPTGTLCRGPLVYKGGPVMHTSTTYVIYWLPTARNTARPVVSGKAAVTKTLSTSAGSWAQGGAPFSYQWLRCAATGTSCVDIPGATAATYKLTAADGGHAVRATVRASNVNGLSQPTSSTSTSAVVDIPAVTTAPHVSGRVKVGKKLSGSHGSWTFSPTYRYQWLRCNARGGKCSSIRKATRSSYKLTRRDLRHRLRLRVTALNAAGTTVATSAASARIRR